MASASPRSRPQIIKVTPAAIARLQDLMRKQVGAGLRVGVKNGGCAGMEYTMEWATEQGKFDEVVEQDGARVLIDAKAVMFLLGTEMDYQETTLKSGFVFNNPNQISACGCGESVELKPAGA
ncbi:MAG: iron-sulfur cluster assembly accessory protein [Alphaproteobacteria bacterium]|nr:iron-sulfur cluster assembly accessory protein [Alphaproteobacteria bacterium]